MKGGVVLKPRGPMGFRSTSVKQDQEWEDTDSFAPPVVYTITEDRGVLRSIRRLLGRAENE